MSFTNKGGRSTTSAGYYVRFAGVTPSENDVNAQVVLSLSGVLATDIVTATIQAQAGTATILTAVPTTDTLTFNLSGNGGAGTIIQYSVLRAS